MEIELSDVFQQLKLVSHLAVMVQDVLGWNDYIRIMVQDVLGWNNYIWKSTIYQHDFRLISDKIQ